MPRSGGESGKLGDRYEAVWTVDSLIDVLVGDAKSIVVEPFDASESLGIEFVKDVDGAFEFHSAKRQTTGQLWSLADLMRVSDNGRSVLGDLFEKLEQFPGSRVTFVSGTTARDLEEICGAAVNSNDATAFDERLKTISLGLRKKFEDRLLRPQFNGDLPTACQTLRRIRVVGWTEDEMIRRIDQRIRATFYRTDGTSLDATAVRCLLAEMVFGWFGLPIRRQAIIDCLAEHGVAERDWARERGPRELVERRNDAYMGHVEAELIAGARIPRTEAGDAAEALLRGGKKRVVMIGAAGLGKSCTVVQTLAHLRREGIPALALRLDLQTEVLTSRRLGEALGLPESPVLVLAGIANGGRCVLVLDQLDAISFASGRNQRLWDVFEEMLGEAKSYPQMRVLLACRAFDAEHDPRLRRLLTDCENTVRIDLGILPLETVSNLVREKAGVDPAVLDPAHLELLRAPLHLSLYLQSDPQQQPQFRNVQDLLGRYWTHKRRLVTQQLGRESRWHEIIQQLVDRLSHNQTLSAPRTIVDRFDEVEIGAMASQNVIVLDGDSVRFFHEAFFDYCFARLFAEKGQTLLDFLLEGGREQHLFRRAQVRQILEYRRDRDWEHGTYLRDLRDLLTDTRVRYHLKKLALDWLNGLAAPREEEWRLLESLNPATPVGRWARRVPWGRPVWFALLERMNVWKEWLELPDAKTVSIAVHMLSLPDVMKACSVDIARLFRAYVEGQKPWREEFCELFCFGEAHHSREMFELLRDATRLCLLVPPNRHEWSGYDKLAKERPDYAVELLAVLLDLEASELGVQNDDESWDGDFAMNFLVETARRAPEAFAREVMPRVIEEWNKRDPENLPGGRRGRRLLRRLSFSAYDVSAPLERGLEIALGVLARDQPQVLDLLSAPIEMLPRQTFSAVLLSAWEENTSHYSDKIVRYLLSDVERLGLGYLMWGTGNGIAAIGRAAVRCASPHCSQANYLQLEAAILTFTTEGEREDPKRLGYRRMLLLECLPPDRISQKARLHFEELKRKFPWETFEMPEHGPRSGFVGSPVPQEAANHMTDEQWIQAMRRYATERDRETADFWKGGKDELSSVLRTHAQTDKPRFAQLALRMEESIAPEYFNAILSGISRTTLDNSGEPKLPPSAQEPLDAEVVAHVITRVHVFGKSECARDICWAIRRVAERTPPQAITPILCHYAVNDPDPDREQWQEMSHGSHVYGGDPLSQGINSVRGSAAEALAALLFSDHNCFPAIEPAVLSVVHDRSIAVRSCAILCLVAMLNFDRDRAVRLFLELAENADAVLSTHHSEEFIHHATYRHYELLRPLLLHMLKVTEEEARSIAGRQITLAAFHVSQAANDAQEVLAGDHVCRRAAAEIYAHNLKRAASRSVCAERLEKLFDDPDSKVRATASDCFRLLPSNQLAQEQGLMFQFIESQACIENSHDLILALEKCAEPLPEVICRMPERIIAEHRTQDQLQPIQSRRWTYNLPALIARLYEQTPDSQIKTRCLNIIDGMLELGFSEIEEELAQVER